MQPLVVAVALAPALASCGHASGEGWLVRNSANVRVFSSPDDDLARTVQTRAEQIAGVYRATFFPNLPTKPVDVLVLKSKPGELTRVGYPTDNPPSSWSLESLPGGGNIGRDGLVVVSRGGSHGSVPLQIAYQMIHQAIPNAPLWLRLGFGQYLEKVSLYSPGYFRDNRPRACYGSQRHFPSTEMTYRSEPKVYGSDRPLSSHSSSYGIVPGYPYGTRPFVGTDTKLDPNTGARVFVGPERWNLEATSFAGGALLPMASVLAVNWYDYTNGSQAWFEFTAFTFVHYLIHGQKAQPAQFQQLLDALTAGQTTERALALAYPNLRIERLDDVLKDYTHPNPLKSPYFGTSPAGLCSSVPDTLVTTTEAVPTPAPATDVQTALNDLAGLPLWRDRTSWYPTEVLRSRAAVLSRTPAVRTPARKQNQDSSERPAGASGPLPVFLPRP